MENIDKLTEQVNELLAIYDKTDPIKKDGTFDAEAVKNTTIEMIDYIVEDDRKQLLKDWLESHEYWTSPASTRFHGNVKGGLAAHSLMVARQSLYFAVQFANNYLTSKVSDMFEYTAFDVFIAAIAHDFCKSGSYQTEHKKTKDYQGNWVYSSYYKTKTTNRNLGHGNESVLLVLEIFPELLARRHVLEAISRHMGFSDLTDTEMLNYTNMLQNPLVLLIQLADQSAAAWWDI